MIDTQTRLPLQARLHFELPMVGQYDIIIGTIKSFLCLTPAGDPNPLRGYASRAAKYLYNLT